MPKLIDLTGRRFGRLVVVKLVGRRGYNQRHHWLCRCDCGSSKVIAGQALKAGATRSCGCLVRETSAKVHTTHGMRRTPIYQAWSSMRTRCENPNNISYSRYGGRGIRICKRWETFDNFYEDMGPTWFVGASLERINVNGNYQPSNCKWIKSAEQARNRTSSIILSTPAGKMIAKDAAALYGLNPKVLYDRIAANWPRKHLFDPVGGAFTKKRRSEGWRNRSDRQ